MNDENTEMYIKKKNNVLNKKFVEVCEKGDLNAVTELYNRYYIEHLTTFRKFLSFLKIAPKTIYMLDPHYDDDCALEKSSENKHYDIVKFLLNDSKFFHGVNREGNISWRLSKVLCDALEENNVEIAQLVLPLIKNKTEAFYQSIGTSFSEACGKGNLDVIKYILKDDSINNQKFEIFEDENNTTSSCSIILNGFFNACAKGQLDVIKFLTSGELNYKIDLSKLKKNNELEIREPKIMEYLIFEYKLDKIYYRNPIIYRNREQKSWECDDYVNNLFEKRDLHKELQLEIDNKEDNRIVPKKLKV
jgi:hypothetical protein